MEENQLSQNVQNVQSEPLLTDDNSEKTTEQSGSQNVGDKSSDPSTLILGKFKSADDLTEAYKQLEKLQGNQSSELGALREKVAKMNQNNEAINLLQNLFAKREQFQEAANKYPDYFSDPSFKQLYSEAYKAFGDDLDVDRLVNLVESYASARIFAYEKSKIAKSETEQARGSMKFDKNDKTTQTPVRKSIQQMTPKELDEMLDKLI